MNALHSYNEFNHRLHRTPLGLLPGVTTVLSNTADKGFVDRWRAKVGAEAADLILAMAIDRGNNLHAYIESYFEGSKIIQQCKYPENRVHLDRMIAVIKPYIEKIEPLHIETPTWHSLGFGGSPDCVGLLDGKVTIFDWKNSLKPKKEDYVADYYLQTAAYSLSVEYTLGIKPVQTRIAVAAIKGDGVILQEFKIDEHELEMVQNAFVRRLQKYQARFPSQF